MSRSIERDDRERVQQSRMTLSQGRGGSGSDGSDFQAELAQIIDTAAAGQPTMSQFIERLDERGVTAIPSIQSSGRLNGFAFRWKGQTIRGSSIGREYTAKGLQHKKGICYDPGRDQDVLVRAAERAGLQRPQSDREIRPVEQERRDFRRKDRSTGLSADQEAVLAEIGKFRTLHVGDLAHHCYAGNGAAFAQDLRVLKELGLAEQRTAKDGKTARSLQVVVLTRKGRNHLRKRQKENAHGQPAQQFYAGFVKPSEVPHAAIYRMYQVEADRIEGAGGHIRRVVLDYELKRKVYSELNKDSGLSASEYAERKRHIAAQNGLQVVQGKVVFPDLRIEYETRDQEQSKVDLELATAAYKNEQVQAKRAAGLRIYSPDDAPRSPALQDPEIVAGLISL